MPWIHVDDVVGIYLRAIDDASWSGAVNATAPEPVTNRTFSKALGKAVHRPAVAPIPGAAIRLLYGDMAEIVTKGQRVVPPARRSNSGTASGTGTSTRRCGLHCTETHQSVRAKATSATRAAIMGQTWASFLTISTVSAMR